MHYLAAHVCTMTKFINNFDQRLLQYALDQGLLCLTDVMNHQPCFNVPDGTQLLPNILLVLTYSLQATHISLLTPRRSLCRSFCSRTMVSKFLCYRCHHLCCN